MSKVYIYGWCGGMARRYRAILKHLGHEAGGCDVRLETGFALQEADAVLVATPTETHARLLWEIKDCGLPILCEKPLARCTTQLSHLVAALVDARTRFQMVSQYDYLVDPASSGDTIYDYFRHGDDGLAWDTINVHRHAKGKITLREDSPVWTCQINGKVLSLADMDAAYVEMVDHWLREPDRPTDWEGILHAHRQAARLEAQWRAS